MSEIPFKAIAVDMDGTFLNDKKDYDRELFAKVLKAAQDQGIHFIVASGNQYMKLRKDFYPHADEVDYVAENGAYLIVDNQDVGHTGFNAAQTQEISAYLDKFPQVHYIICGLNRAYFLESETEELKKIAHFYYPRHKQIDNVKEIGDEPVLKFSLVIPDEETKGILQQMSVHFGDRIHVTSSGFGSIDMMVPHVNKAKGLRQLLAHWDLTMDDLIAFGDGGNDLEMLEAAGISYGMENGDPVVKKVVDHIAPNNNDSGVLKVLADYLL